MKPMKLRSAIGAFLAVATLGACSNGNLPDYNILGELRVLALKADQPEVDPTTNPTVNITPVVSDVYRGRTLSYSAKGCIDPGVGYGATPSCPAGVATATLGSGTIPALDPTKLTSTGIAPVISVPITSALFTSRSDTDKFNGIAYLVIYTLTATNTDGSTSQVNAFKRIIGSTRTPKNTNPTITDVVVGAQSLQTFLSTLTFPPAAGLTAALQPVLGSASVETYQQKSAAGTATLTETLTTTWFVSDGTTTYYRTIGTDSDTWTPPGTKPATITATPRGIVIVAVTRDGRGGEDFKISVF